MPLLDLEKLTAGLSPTWAGYLRDWDRTLRSGNSPETTRSRATVRSANAFKIKQPAHRVIGRTGHARPGKVN